MMKAQAIMNYGGVEEFQTIEIPIPEVGPGQVLVKVHATSVNPIDLKIRSGAVKGLVSSNFPLVLHSDIAGEITQLGSGVTKWQVGDEIIASQVTTMGALADYAVVDASVIAKKPSNLSFAEAAALPLVSITAWEALIDRIKLTNKQQILIHGATGGVGHIAIQIAKLKGAKVATTVSTESKAEIAQKLGADEIIYYPHTTVDQYVERLTGGHGFDAVLDTVGGENVDRSLQAVRTYGQVALIAARSTHDLTPLHNKALTLHGIFMIQTQQTQEGKAYHGSILSFISDWVERGHIRPIIDKEIFRFAEVGKAHEKLASGKTIGKVVLTNQ